MLTLKTRDRMWGGENVLETHTKLYWRYNAVRAGVTTGRLAVVEFTAARLGATICAGAIVSCDD